MKSAFKQGFSLVEFMVYLVGFSLVITLGMHTLITLTLKARSTGKQTIEALQLNAALDCIAFEFAQAPPSKRRWQSIEKDCCIWHSHKQKKDIGICLIDKKLVKIQGNYSPEAHRWRSKISNTLAENVKECSFEIDTYCINALEYVRTVRCTISSPTGKIKKTINLNNGYRV